MVGEPNSNEKVAKKLDEVSKTNRENMQNQNAFVQQVFNSVQSTNTSSSVQNNQSQGGGGGQGYDESIDKIYRGDIL